MIVAEPLQIALTLVLMLMLGWGSLVDLRQMRLPDVVTLGLVALGLTLSGQVSGLALADRLIGAGAGFLLFWAIGEAHFRLRGTEGLGLGDAKLFAAVGAWLGWQMLPMVLLIAAVPALLLALWRGAEKPLPFGPFLAVAFLTLWLF